MKHFLLFCLFLLCASAAHAQDTIRICTYYLLNYSTDNEDGRTAQFKTVIEQIQPDILVVQDVGDQQAAIRFFTEGLDPNTWSLSQFEDGPDTDNMLYFKFDKLAFLDATQHATALRSISEYRLHVKSSNDTLTVFSAHLTSGETNEDARSEEVMVIQTRLMESLVHKDVAVCGNFNFYAPTEFGYIRLVMMNSSVLYEPLGGWERDNEAFSSMYTQSTRTEPNGACGGGVGGGLDDRFDMILFSPSMIGRYIQGSYTTYGNDGENRLNSSIVDPPNIKVYGSVASALMCASDHLPVYADFIFDTPTDVHEHAAPALEASIAPMPVVGDAVVNISMPVGGTFTLSVCDVLGRPVLAREVVAEQGRQQVALPALPAGVYLCRIVGSGRSIALPFTVVR